MDNELRGSNLTRAMLNRDDIQVWCAIDDESDERAMTNISGNDFMAYIVAFKDGFFYCTGGMQWLHAVPIKIVPIAQHELVY